MDNDILILCECGFIKLSSCVVCDICYNIAIECDLSWDDD
jgi:hypothetical protein